MTDEAMSPLRRRMIEDMTIRKFAPKTQHDYLQRVKNFAAFLGRSPDTASFEDVRRYQLHLTTSGVGVPTVNQTACRSPHRRSAATIGSATSSWSISTRDREPFGYLKDILERMSNGHSMSRLDDLLPWNWAPSTEAAA